jgi:hypothetical protein
VIRSRPPVSWTPQCAASSSYSAAWLKRDSGIGPGEPGRQPNPVRGQRLAVREAEALEVDQFGVLGQVELSRHLDVVLAVQGQHNPRLRHPASLDLAEEVALRTE